MKKCERSIGVHIRLHEKLAGVALRAIEYGINTFQCFMINQSTGRPFRPTIEDQKSFAGLRHQFGPIFLHASYWINPSSVVRYTHRVLEREIAWADRLDFTYLILHPGSAKGGESKIQGIEALARVVNGFFKQKHQVQLVLENMAHTGLSIGGDLHDFKILLEKIDCPERLRFCIDSAHAYSYGYNLADNEGLQDFLKLIDETIGFEQIAVIHLNDTQQRLGGYIDRHAVLGDGHIGFAHAKQLVMYPELEHVPIILELPVLPFDREKEIIDVVKSWHKEKR